MPVATTMSAVVLGVRAHAIQVQAQIAQGLPHWRIVGLPDASLSESHERVRAATISSGLTWPGARITVGLSPASLPKRGSGLDLAIALAIQAAAGALPEKLCSQLSSWLLVGELGLDGRVGSVGSVLPAAVVAREEGVSRFVVPAGNRREASLIPGVEVLPVDSLARLWACLTGTNESLALPPPEQQAQRSETQADEDQESTPDLADVRGQSEGRRAVVIAAAGGHHLALVGAAGVGKSLLAQRLPSLLPDLDDEQALEVSAIRALLTPENPGSLVRRPPVHSPHHTTTDIALIGGGSGQRPTIGLVTAAHHGVLVLDEAAEFSSVALESLRQAMESGEVTIARGNFRVRLPAQFQLVATSNTCPCGRAMDTLGAPCSCASVQLRRYRTRLNGPMADRIELRLILTRPSLAELTSTTPSPQSTAQAREHVLAARDRMAHRLAEAPWRVNARVPTAVLRHQWAVPPELQAGLDSAAASRESVRGLDIALRVAWTLADLQSLSAPGPDQLAEALSLRGSKGWVE